MNIIAINLTLIEFIVLPLVAIIFGATVYFFLKSRKTLQETLRESKKAVLAGSKKNEPDRFRLNVLTELKEQLTRTRKEVPVQKQEKPEAHFKNFIPREETTVQDLKNTIAQQQKMLNSYLKKVEDLEQEGRKELNNRIIELEKQSEQFQNIIAKKDEEIKELEQEAAVAQKMAAKIEEVYREFEQLQTKMAALEKQASRANNLAIELEDTKYAYEQIHKELMRKQEKLEEVMEDNQNRRYQINELEDKLAEANLQRQQLQKKVQFLTDLNNDMQNIADTNKKLQTELRRIGELESMLNIMAEERDFLLRKKKDR